MYPKHTIEAAIADLIARVRYHQTRAEVWWRRWDAAETEEEVALAERYMTRHEGSAAHYSRLIDRFAFEM